MSSTVNVTPRQGSDRSRECESHLDHFRKWRHLAPNRVVVRQKERGVWKETTWAELWEQVENVAHRLREDMGVSPGDRVAILSETRREWFIADLAVSLSQAVTVGIYPTNPVQAVELVFLHSGARLCIVEDQEQYDKMAEIRRRNPNLDFEIVTIDHRGIDDDVWTWERVTEPAAQRETYDRLRSGIHADDLATLIYTSGTQGTPKGVMLTHRALSEGIDLISDALDFIRDDDEVLTYLPLCHMAERIYTFTMISGGVRANFAESVDTVQQNLNEVAPTLFFSVPRIWEKMAARLKIEVEASDPIRRFIAHTALRIGKKRANKYLRGERVPVALNLAYRLADGAVLRHLLRQIGLHRVRHAWYGAAAMAEDLVEFFGALGLTLCNHYGSTEAGGGMAYQRSRPVLPVTAGKPLGQFQVDDTGELWFRSPAMFVGYYNAPDLTAETIVDGWYRTGDIGRLNHSGEIELLDRAKDVIKTSGGKQVAAGAMENALRASPFVREAIVLGEGRPYVSALIALEMDTLTPWCERHGVAFADQRDLALHPAVIRLIQETIDDTNEHYSRPEQIKQFRILPRDLDIDDGEVTPTMKVRRFRVTEQFGDLIEDMYRSRKTA